MSEKTADVKEEELVRFFIPVFSDSEEREEKTRSTSIFASSLKMSAVSMFVS